jgi:hypothetical protein
MRPDCFQSSWTIKPSERKIIGFSEDGSDEKRWPVRYFECTVIIRSIRE